MKVQSLWLLPLQQLLRFQARQNSLQLTAVISFCAVLSLLSGCASLSRPSVSLRSKPEGVEVFTLQGEKLGLTPLLIEGELLQKAAQGGRLAVMLSSAGHVQKEILLDVHGSDVYEVTLNPMDLDYFSKRWMNEYSLQANAMSRELLRIQGLMLARKLDEADDALIEFQKTYPNIAASFVLQASIELSKGRLDRARTHLERALSIDPNDAVAARMNSAIRTGSTRVPAATAGGKSP